MYQATFAAMVLTITPLVFAANAVKASNTRRRVH